MTYDETQSRRAAARFFAQLAMDYGRVGEAVIVLDLARAAGCFSADEFWRMRDDIAKGVRPWGVDDMTYTSPAAIADRAVIV
jgi:hypothetical protein